LKEVHQRERKRDRGEVCGGRRKRDRGGVDGVEIGGSR
jgi:hypothetical protein